jgi:hypothetical protein
VQNINPIFVRVDEPDSSIMPMLSTLYSTDREGGKGFSENKKILELVAMVSAPMKKRPIAVIDRGGDRRKLIYPG